MSRKILPTLFVLVSVMCAGVAESAEPTQANVIDTRKESKKRPTKQRPLAISSLKTKDVSAAERGKFKRKHLVAKPSKTRFSSAVRRNVLIVKFVDGARVRLNKPAAGQNTRKTQQTVSSRLDSLEPKSSDLDDYDRALLKRHDLTPVRLSRQMTEFRNILKARKLKSFDRMFRIKRKLLADLRLNAEVKKRRQSSDLSNYYVFEFDDEERGEQVADELNALDIVEIAYLAPIPEDADVPPTTASFEGRQTYLGSAPGGIDAKYSWGVPGGKGNQVKIIDIESGWNLNHEDLPSMFITDGRIDTDDSRQHGTAVMGVMLGLDDGVGVTGIVPEASGGVVSVKRGLGIAYYDNVAEAVLIASISLSPGDVIVIEQHARGPGNDGDCTACITSDGKPRDQCGYVAMEYWNDIFDAINAATAAGIIVVEAAGNGEMNLDHARYKDRFNRNVRNSGAVLVGAGEFDTRKPKCWSNHGSRLDAQGWGENVMTAGYGSSNAFKANGGDDNQWYTTSFSGTSSATPIVAGAVAAIQGVQLENNNPVLDWAEIADLIKSTGTPQTGGKTIGPLPDLKAAISSLVVDQPPSPDDAVYEYTVTADGPLLDSDRDVSGFSGARTRTLGEAADLAAIERLKFGERGDRGCYVRVEKADFVKNAISKPHAELDLCGSNGPTDRSLDYVPLLTTSHDTFVHGVSVCNSKTNNSTRLKGAKLYRTRIESDGSLSKLSNPTTWDRTNCDDNWRTPALCPSGSVATKLVVHIRDDGNDEVFTGLALKCKEVKVARTCVSGCTP